MFYTRLRSMLWQAPGWAVGVVFDRRTITLLRHRVALGDTLMLTALARGLKKARPDCRVAVATKFPALFAGNPYFDEIRDWHLLRTRRTVRPKYGKEDLRKREHVVQIQWRSLWEELRGAGVAVSGECPPLDGHHPELFLTETERRHGREILHAAVPSEARGKPMILLTSGGNLRPVHNREWGLENYQALVDALAPHAAILQFFGNVPLLYKGRPLPNLAGHSPRESAALFQAADALLLQEGGSHHLARAVQAPAVVLYGGSLHPGQTGYPDQVNLASCPPCSPCMAERRNCPHLLCMTPFSPRRVAQALAQVLASRGKRLSAEAIAAAPEGWTPPAFVDRALLNEKRSAGELLREEAAYQG